jgi:SAM-dependent methyltransferase
MVIATDYENATIWCLPLWVCGGDNALMDATYWRSEADDEAMQDEHESIWRAMLDTIDVDLAGRRVLDAGCNRGGFLRLLADRYGIAEGFGFDPAAGAIEDAQRLAGGRPLHFEAASSVPAAWSGLDVAFSHEVLYLLCDLAHTPSDSPDAHETRRSSHIECSGSVGRRRWVRATRPLEHAGYQALG